VIPAETNVYRLFIANRNYSSWSLRPWILLTELDIPFETEVVPFDDGGSFSKFRPFSPTGQVPCLHDGASVIWESLGITEYLAERHPLVWPEEDRARAWSRCASAEMHAGFNALRNDCPMTVGIRLHLKELNAALTKDLSRLTELWEQGLDLFGGPFLAGNRFSAVDAFFAPVVYRWQTYDLALGDAATGYAERLLRLQGMQDWEAAALEEPWREPSHEAEIAALGEIVEDRRH